MNIFVGKIGQIIKGKGFLNLFQFLKKLQDAFNETMLKMSTIYASYKKLSDINVQTDYLTADINRIQLKLYQDIKGTVSGLKDLYVVVDPSGKYNYLNYRSYFTVTYEVYHENGKDHIMQYDRQTFDEINGAMKQAYRNLSYQNMIKYFGGYNDAR